jgi:hypothetical protein
MCVKTLFSLLSFAFEKLREVCFEFRNIMQASKPHKQGCG